MPCYMVVIILITGTRDNMLRNLKIAHMKAFHGETEETVVLIPRELNKESSIRAELDIRCISFLFERTENCYGLTTQQICRQLSTEKMEMK